MTDLWKSDADWFVHWFNSPAYHALYANRDEDEAKRFVLTLAEQILADGSRVLDMGCGAGRHAASLSLLGFRTDGLDLSANSIEKARHNYAGLDGVGFHLGDMRSLPQLFQRQSFDAVLSLFTSMGYFEDPSDLSKTLRGVDHVLKPNGLFVLDFLNPEWVRHSLVEQETKSMGPYDFQIHRRIHGGWIEKSIRYRDLDGADRHHVERVRALEPEHWKSHFRELGWETVLHCGDYAMNPWRGDAPRSILVARKPPCG